MKKNYIKPYLIIESFQLDATVASCSGNGGISINHGENTCDFNNKQYFGSANGCTFDLTQNGPVGDTTDQICYHGPEVAGVMFISS